MVLVCRKCDGLNEFPRNWVEDADACQHCGSQGFWRTTTEPKVDYELTLNDQRLLKSLHIDPS